MGLDLMLKSLAAGLFGVGLAHSVSAQPLTVDLAAEASRAGRNDEIRAVVFSEATGTSPAEVARSVNKQIEEGLKIIKANPKLKVQTGSTSTYPIYGKDRRIESWRMRSEIIISSGETTELPALIGRLQAFMGVASIGSLLSDESRQKLEFQAMTDAIAAFKDKAALVAKSFGKPYRIVSLNIGGQQMGPPIMPMVRSQAMAADMTNMPIQAGESEVRVGVSGRIQILD